VNGELGPDEVRWEGGRPAAVGGRALGQATRIAETGTGFWGLYGLGEQVVVVHPGGAIQGRAGEVADRLRAMAGDDGRDGADREAAASFLPFLGGDDPGRVSGAPRSQAETGGLPPTYRLSDETNSPPGAMPGATEAEPPHQADAGPPGPDRPTPS
jgi:hypothetical protein